jgi:hypothetical protein
MNQLVINLENEKQKIIDQIFEHDIIYPQLDNKILKFIEEYDFSKEYTLEKNEIESTESIDENNEIVDNQDKKDAKIKQKISEELDKYLPENIICNSQIPF